MAVSQGKNTGHVLERFSMHKSKPFDTPTAANFLSLSCTGHKDDEERKEVVKHPYRASLGCLLYLARHTRADITFTVALLFRSVEYPTIHHWTTAKHLL